MGNNLYDTLGVSKDATDEEIKAAYRKLGKEFHPDKPGGSNEKMQEIVKAYEVLKSQSARDRYDRTGQVEDDTFDNKLHVLLQMTLIQIIDQNRIDNLETDDIARRVGKLVNQTLSQMKEKRNDLKTRHVKLTKVFDRFTSKDNHLVNVMTKNIRDTEKNIAIHDDEIKFLEQAYAVVSDYRYEFIQPEPEPIEKTMFKFATYKNEDFSGFEEVFGKNFGKKNRGNF